MSTPSLASSGSPRASDSASAVPVPISGTNNLTGGSSSEETQRECPLRSFGREFIQTATDSNYSPLQYFFGHASRFLKSSLTRRIIIRLEKGSNQGCLSIELIRGKRMLKQDNLNSNTTTGQSSPELKREGTSHAGVRGKLLCTECRRRRKSCKASPIEGTCMYCYEKGLGCSQKISKQAYLGRGPSDNGTQLAQAMVYIDCFLKSIKLGDPNATDELLLITMKKGIEQRQHQLAISRKRHDVHMADEIDSDEFKSEPVSVNIMPATPPPKKRMRLDGNGPSPSDETVKGTDRATHPSDPFEGYAFQESTSSYPSTTAPSSAPYAGLEANVGGTLSLRLNAESNTAEFKHTYNLNDTKPEEVKQCLGDFWGESFDCFLDMYC